MANSNLRIDFIHPQDLYKCWDKIREGLLKVKAHSNDSWMPEDVYMSLKTNNATLHVGYVNDEYAGFFVLEPRSNYAGPYLHIWALYSEARNFDLFSEGMETVKQFAKNMNATRITFLSPRKGWGRQCEKLGFTPRTVQYALEV